MTMTRKRTASLRSADASALFPGAGSAERDRAEVIYRHIHAALVAQRLPPGTRLPEEHLAGLLGVSRTLVRQALQRLAHDHLVVLEPNRGARVAQPTIAEVRQLYGVRRLLECAALSDLDLRLTRAKLSALKRIVADEARANTAGNVQLSMQLSGRFHLDLMAGCGNDILLTILRDLIARGNVAIALYEMRGRASCRCDDHRHILQRLADGDTENATDLMRRHLSDIEASLTLSRLPRGPVDLADVLGPPITTPARTPRVSDRKS